MTTGNLKHRKGNGCPQVISAFNLTLFLDLNVFPEAGSRGKHCMVMLKCDKNIFKMMMNIKVKIQVT